MLHFLVQQRKNLITLPKVSTMLRFKELAAAALANQLVFGCLPFENTRTIRTSTNGTKDVLVRMQRGRN